MIKRTITAILLISFCTFQGFISFCSAEDSRFQKKKETTPHTDSQTNTILYALELYQKYISSADGDRCPMTPTCSAYSKQSFKKYGAFKGWIMTCDRLMRCGRDELRISPVFRIKGSLTCYDPPENNQLEP